MATKKVLFVATVDSHIELFHLPYLKMFRDKGWEVHVATNTDKPIKYCDKKIKLSICRSPMKMVANIKAIRELKKVIGQEKYEIVHCHTPMGGVVARLAAKKFRRSGTRVIYTAHGFHFYKGAPLHYWLMYYPVEKYLSKYTDTLITINQEDYERARKKFGKRCYDIQYVPGVGVDEKKFAKKMSVDEKKKLRESLGLGEDDKVLICVGRLDKNKNQGFLVRTMKQLMAEDAKYHLLLVGPDEYGGKYQRLALKLGVEKNVHFLGFREDVSELLQIADVMVSASKREGLPVNLIEAAVLGVPIVATDCRGNRDVCGRVGEGATILNNDGDFINALSGVFKVGLDAKNKSQYDFVTVVDEMEKIYFRKKRVLHVLSSDRYSGAENVACTIIENLSEEFDMAYCSLSGPIAKILERRGIKYFGAEKINFRNLKRIVKEYNPDIIHAHDYSASVKVALLKYRGEMISHLHNNNPFARYWNPKTVLYALCVRRFGKILVVSDKIIDEAVFKKYIKGKSITVRNLVDPEKIIAKSKAYKFAKKYDLCFIGRKTQQKDPATFIKIVDLLKNDNSKIKACMIGDGELDNECRNMISRLGLGANIDMFGFLDNPFPIIKNCDACVMPSKWEGFGITAIESLILGKPVFNSGVGGLAEIFSEDSYFICEKPEEYVRKIGMSKERARKTISSICLKYTDKNSWKNKMFLAYGYLTGGR